MAQGPPGVPGGSAAQDHSGPHGFLHERRTGVQGRQLPEPDRCRDQDTENREARPQAAEILFSQVDGSETAQGCQDVFAVQPKRQDRQRTTTG